MRAAGMEGFAGMTGLAGMEEHASSLPLNSTNSVGSARSNGSSSLSSSSSSSQVNVVVRVRPVDESVKTCVSTSSQQVQLDDPVRPLTISVDAALSADATQADVFHVVGWPMVDHCMDGFNSTIFAYGQTGSGKTHTMMGDVGGGEGAGLIPRVFARLFEAMGDEGNTSSGNKSNVEVSCSFLEIYKYVGLLNSLSSSSTQTHSGTHSGTHSIVLVRLSQ